MINYNTFAHFTGVFPNVEAVNVSAPGAGDGTEFIAALVNDIWGRAQALMDYAGLSPDGVTEAAGTAQYLDAIAKGYGIGPGVGVIYWKAGTPAVNGDRVLLLTGSIIDITGIYSRLADAVWVGSTDNASAPAFYRTSDSGGTTRNSGGDYLVLPDTRGLSLKNIGDAIISGRTKTGPVLLGEVQEDQMQRIEGVFNCGGIGNNITLLGATPSLEGVFTQGALQPGGSVNVITGTEFANRYALNFSSADSDDARTSATTDGNTRDSTIGVRFGITY